MNQSIANFQVKKHSLGVFTSSIDVVAVEEPLSIELAFYENGFSTVKNLSVTMRTPHRENELAIGFLYTEGIITSLSDIHDIQSISRPYSQPSRSQLLTKQNNTTSIQANTVRVILKPHVQIDFKKLERHFYTTSSCGVCGKSSISAVRVAEHCRHLPFKENLLVSPEVIYRLPDTLRRSQEIFEQTGGLHAAAMFNDTGELLLVCEDIGRHNALDKLIGASLLDGLSFRRAIVLVSGRLSFELVQKAVMANVPILCAVGAPSSLAIELADEFDLTLVGFIKPNRFNIYASDWRINQNKAASFDTTDPFTYRAFSMTDAKGVYETALESFQETYKHIFSPETIEQIVKKDFDTESLISLVPRIQSNDMCFYVALHGHQVIGFCNFGFCEKGLELRRLYLKPEYIGKGVGKTLLKLGEDFARSKGTEKYFCFVHIQNEIGKQFYLKNGFYHNDQEDYHDQWYMQKDIGSMNHS